MLGNLPASLFTAVAVQVACQAFKVAYYSVRDGRLSLSWFVSAGGMPSAHSAFVSALSVSVGLWSGFDSDVFAVAAVFSVITMYDAYRLRGAVEHHARLLVRLVSAARLRDAGAINQRLGHSLPEIAAGIAAGSGLAFVAWIALRAAG
jgi:uncharacterized protein